MVVVAGHGQVFLQLGNIVPVDGSDVAESQLLEQHSAQNARLDRILNLVQQPFHRVADDGHFVEDALHFRFQAGIERRHPQTVEIVSHRTYPGANRHFVVVKNDGKLFFQPAGVVHCLEDYARGKGPVADHGHSVPVFICPQKVVAATQPQRRRYAAAGVARHQQVVDAFLGIGVAHQPALGTDRIETIVAAGHHFVRVDLVACVPDQAVAAEIEGGVQGERQFDNAQVRSKVRRARGHNSAKGLAYFGCQLHKLLLRKVFQIAGRADCRKEFVH